MLLLLLVAAPSYQMLFGSEPYTGLTKSDLPEDLPKLVAVAKDGSAFVVASNNRRDGAPKPNTMGDYVAKIDPSGALSWWTYIGYNGDASVAAATDDGGVLVAGKARYVEPTPGTVFFKYDKDGKLEWKRKEEASAMCDGKTCARAGGDPAALVILADGGFAMLVHLQANDDFDALVRYDRQGQQTSVKILDALVAKETPVNVPTALSPDGSLWTVITDAESPRIEVRRYDASGERTLTKTFDGPGGNEFVPTVSATPRGGVVVCGWYRGGKEGAPNATYFAFDAAGERTLDWSGHSDERVQHGAQLGDGSYVFVVGGFEGEQVSLQRIGKDGKLEWKKPFGEKRTVAHQLVSHPDGGAVLVAYTKGFGAWYSDIFVMKASATGDLGKPPPKRPPPAKKAK